MSAAMHSHMGELRELCARFHVRTLELFGSATRADFRPGESDLDFFVEFLPLEPAAHAAAYFELLEALQDLFGCGVDLVEVKAIANPFFLRMANQSRELLYAA